MDILIIAGFLGSGKTTLVLEAISKIIKLTGRKVVIIVNDFGTVGIDGKVMARCGLEVRELASGCICCSLGTDLMSTIEEVKSTFDPDLVVIEPTGVADPQAIVEVLHAEYPREGETLRSVVLVDAVRFEVILKALQRPLEAQIRSADLILINKVDAVRPEVISSIEATLRTLNSNSPIIPISASMGVNLDAAIEAMVSL